MYDRTNPPNTASGASDTASLAPPTSACSLPLGMQADERSVGFATLYATYGPSIFAYFFQHVRHHHDAEDLTALTFAEALRSRPHYSEQGRFEAWLWSIARHKLRDVQRRQHTTVPVEQVAAQLTDPGPSPEVQALRREHVALLQHLVDELPADQRAVVRLRYFDEWSFNDIATRLNRSVGAVKMLVQRALTTLRSRYLQYEQRQVESATARRSAKNLQTRDVTFRLLSSMVSTMSVFADLRRQVVQSLRLPTLQPVRNSVPAHDQDMQRRRRRASQYENR